MLGTTQPIKKVTKNPPVISRMSVIGIIVSRNLPYNAEGIPNKNTNIVTKKTDLLLMYLNLSIKEATGTSNKETEEVIAAI